MTDCDTPDPIRQVADNYARVCERVAEAAVRSGRESSAVTIVCVTKTVMMDRIRAVYAAGARVFGENRVQEAEDKIDYWRAWMARLPAEWHLIGHLQTNKARTAARLFDCVHSIDSVRLAREVGRRAGETGRVLPVLLEVNVSGEPSKGGLTPEDARLALPEMLSEPGIAIRGLMTIAPLNAPGELARPYFGRLRELRDALQREAASLTFADLSMGMTNDYEAAIAEGATIVRVGRAIFGER
jgi:hypothetical protein